MRHAKAEPFASTDQARELTDRGRTQATAAGEHLAGSGAVPEYVVVSPATRALQTWEAVAAATGAQAEVNVDPSVYTGGTDVVIEVLSVCPEDAGTVMFVGHNPTASYLCHLLDDGAGDPTALQGLFRGFPPGALAVFDVEVAWQDLAPEAGRVTDFFVVE
jgi:phosphohistidine phosphatase